MLEILSQNGYGIMMVMLIVCTHRLGKLEHRILREFKIVSVPGKSAIVFESCLGLPPAPYNKTTSPGDLLGPRKKGPSLEGSCHREGRSAAFNSDGIHRMVTRRFLNRLYAATRRI